MSLIWLDGFDDYGNNDANVSTLMKTTGYAATNKLYASTDTPHGLGKSLYTLNTSGNDINHIALRRALGGDIEDCIVGLHVKMPDDGLQRILGFEWENGLGSFSTQFMLAMNGQRGITVTNANINVAYAVSEPNVFFPEVWYFLEVRLDIPNNQIVVRVNEDIVINAEFIAPKQQGTNILRLYNKDSFSSTRKKFDNLYIIDANTGAAPFDNFLGEIVVHTSLPNTDAGANDWDIVGTGTDHFAQVDDPVINDADYLTSETVGDIEFFGVEDVPTDTLQVLAVGIATRMRKEAGGTGYFRTKARVGATVADMPEHNPSSNFTTTLDIMHYKPSGGAWTIEDANDLHIGAEVLAPPA